MTERNKKGPKPISPAEFNEITAGTKDNEDTPSALINERNAPIEEMIHPLSYSIDDKKHPSMRAVPAASKFQRDFKKLYEQLRKN